MTMERWFEMPRSWTFQMPKLRRWVESRLEGRVLNLFGGVTRLSTCRVCGGSGFILVNPGPNQVGEGCPEEHLEIVYNDLNPDLPADFRRDAYDLSLWADSGDRFDTVIFDPPYSAFQALKTYGAKKAQLVTHARDVVEYVLKPGGRVISLGFNSTGMGASRGFTKEALALVNCGGSHNDFLILSERHNG